MFIGNQKEQLQIVTHRLGGECRCTQFMPAWVQQARPKHGANAGSTRCRAARRHRNSDISAPGLGLHALPDAPNLPIAILEVDIDAQAVQDREPLVAEPAVADVPSAVGFLQWDFPRRWEPVLAVPWPQAVPGRACQGSKCCASSCRAARDGEEGGRNGNHLLFAESRKKKGSRFLREGCA